MKAPHYLFELIQSLTPSEKSYFKKYASLDGNKDKAYIQLFDIINDIKVYDEELINKKIKKAGITYSISKLKEYLYDIILDSLVSYHKTSNYEIDLYSKYQKNIVLEKKAMYEQSFNYAKELKQDASKGSNHIVSLLSQYKLSDAYSHMHKAVEVEKLELDFEADFARDIEQIKNELYTQLLILKNATKLMMHDSLGSQLNNQFDIEYQEIIDKVSDFVYPEKKALFLNECGIFYSRKLDKVNEFRCKIEALNIFLERDELVSKHMLHTTVCLYNVMARFLADHLYDQFDYLSKILEDTKGKHQKSITIEIQSILDSAFYNFNFTYYLNTWQTPKLTQHVKAMHDWINHGKHVNYQLQNIVKENIVTAYYCLGQSKDAVHFIQNWLNDNDKLLIKNKNTAWVHLIIIHLEEENYEVVKSLLVPAIKYFKATKMDSNYVLHFLSFLKQVLKNTLLINDKEFLQQTLDAISLVGSAKFVIGRSFKFHLWLLSRINKTSYYEEVAKSLGTYNYTLLDNLLSAQVPLYPTNFLLEYQKNTIQKSYFKVTV